jgi:DNA-binding CsgD family transcriptional regulator
VNPTDIVSSTADPVFATDAEGRIVAWNRGAENLFGYAQSRAVGHLCWELLRGCDIFGNRYCGPACPLLAMVRDHEALHRCHVTFHNAAGERTPVRVSLFVFQEQAGSASFVVHLLSATPSHAGECALPGFDAHPGRPHAQLTAREREVLMALAEGKGTPRIAEELGVGVHTVRNHLNRLFRKLHVHGRVEVLAAARRLGLIP